MHESENYKIGLDTMGGKSEMGSGLKVKFVLRPFPKKCTDYVNQSIKDRLSDCPDCDLREKLLEDVSYSGNTRNLIEGNMDLAYRIIHESVSNEPFDVLFFMDKSARNGAYLLKTLWLELDKRKEIPDGVTLPEFRFINMGRNDEHKHKSKTALTLLKLRYGNNFKGKKIVLVDEYVDSGRSIKLGLKTIKDVFKPREIIGIQQFLTCPNWCYDNKHNLKGVVDVFGTDILNSEEMAVSKLEQVKPWQIAKLYRGISNLSESDFCELLLTKNDCKRNWWKITKFMDILDCYGLKPEDSKTVWNYIRTAGGFVTGTSKNEKLIQNNMFYRGVLRTMIVKAMEYRDVNK